MDDFFSKFYENQNTMTSTTEHDISRFTDVGSPRSMHSTKSNKTFKQLVGDNFTDYLLKIKPVNFFIKYILIWKNFNFIKNNR
jgi:hypothetical protein